MIRAFRSLELSKLTFEFCREAAAVGSSLSGSMGHRDGLSRLDLYSRKRRRLPGNLFRDRVFEELDTVRRLAALACCCAGHCGNDDFRRPIAVQPFLNG